MRISRISNRRQWWKTLEYLLEGSDGGNLEYLIEGNGGGNLESIFEGNDGGNLESIFEGNDGGARAECETWACGHH